MTKGTNQEEVHSSENARPRRITAGLVLAIMGIVMYLSTTSCGNNEGKKATASTGNTGSYSTYQQIFCLNMLSDISGMYNGHYGDTILDSTIYAVKTVLASPQATSLIGNWKCIWGPVVVTSPGNIFSPKARNTMFMAQNTDSPSLYVIAIAGTDFKSVYDWMSEDFDVLKTKYWSKVLTDVYDTTWSLALNIDSPYISAATARGLADLMLLKDTTLPGAPNLLGFITNLSNTIAAQSNKTMTLWTTGHSLGGALAPALACYLQDTKGNWASSNANNVNINCLAVAGATPGNEIFSNHYAAAVPNTIRIWNSEDVVPHGFYKPMLLEVDTIYKRNGGLKTPDWIQGTIFTLHASLTFYNYFQLFPAQDTMFTSDFYHASNEYPGTSSNPDTSFFSQLLCQHVPSYPHYFGVDSFQTCVKNLMGFKNPFFSGGYSPAPILAKQAVPVQTATRK